MTIFITGLLLVFTKDTAMPSLHHKHGMLLKYIAKATRDILHQFILQKKTGLFPSCITGHLRGLGYKKSTKQPMFGLMGVI